MTVHHLETNDSSLTIKLVGTSTKSRHGEQKDLESRKRPTRESQVNGKLIDCQTRQI